MLPRTYMCHPMMPTPSHNPGHCPGIRLARREPRNLPTLRRLVKQKESEPAWQKGRERGGKFFFSRRGGGGHAHLRLINFSLLLGRRSPSHALLVLMVFFPFIFSRTTSSSGSSRHAFHAWRNAPTFNTSSRPSASSVCNELLH